MENQINNLPDYFWLTFAGVTYCVENATFNSVAMYRTRQPNAYLLKQIKSLIDANEAISFRACTQRTYEREVENARLYQSHSKLNISVE